jgi:mannose-6-phosphate isomerase-like protein (cupin superfamily)
VESSTIDPNNVANLSLTEPRAADDGKVRWTGAYAAYGGVRSSQSATVYFTIASGDWLGCYTDSTEETQFIVEWSGELHLDSGKRPVENGDVVVLPEGTPHDLANVSLEELRVVGFFAAPGVNQHFDDVMLPSNNHMLGTPNTTDSQD